MTTFQPSDLYNCCTDYKEPDWSEFDALELGGCCTETLDNGDEWTDSGYSSAEAQFYTVFGHLIQGGCEAITDIPSFDQAVSILNHLGEKTGLPIHIMC